MTHARPRQRRGFVLIVALVVTFAIASLVLTLGRVARTESLASANQLAAYEASAVERGAEQYVLAMLANNVDTLGDLDETDWSQVPVGKGFFWVVRPDYLDDDLPQFGLVDEAAKIPLNRVSATNLQFLDDVDPDTATAIVGWRTGESDAGSINSSGGEGFRVKAGPYETVEEMLMVKGVTRELFLGDDALTRMGQAAPTTLTGDDAMRAAGWQNFFTPWDTTPEAQPNQQALPQIAINSAPRDVLIAVLGLPETDVDTALATRRSAIESDPNDVTWAPAVFPGVPTARLVLHGNFFSADIVAAAGNGRAFRRVRIVVDVSSTTTGPQIVYRRDITADGFPLDATILSSLRSGQLAGTSPSSSSRGGKL